MTSARTIEGHDGGGGLLGDPDAGNTRELLRYLQAIGIWFQLLAIAEDICGMIEAEYHRTRDAILAVTGRERMEEPYERFYGRVRARLPLLRTVGRQQVTLIRAFREKGTGAKDVPGELVPLLLSINCIAAGLGWTA